MDLETRRVEALALSVWAYARLIRWLIHRSRFSGTVSGIAQPRENDNRWAVLCDCLLVAGANQRLDCLKGSPHLPAVETKIKQGMPEVVSARGRKPQTEGDASCTAVQEEVEATKGQSVVDRDNVRTKLFLCTLSCSRWEQSVNSCV